jgi:hypothetical protein
MDMNFSYLKFFHFKNVASKFMEMQTWQDKLSALFKGPGWRPGLPRLGDDNFPEVISSQISCYWYLTMFIF